MMDILTPNQLEIAKWLSDQFRAAYIPEVFTITWKLRNSQPNTGTINEVNGYHPEITFASMQAIERAGLIMTLHIDKVSGSKGGIKKTGGVPFYQLGYPPYERSRTYSFLGTILQIPNVKYLDSEIKTKATHQNRSSAVTIILFVIGVPIAILTNVMSLLLNSNIGQTKAIYQNGASAQ
jgi:hypothetical protein